MCVMDYNPELMAW